MGRIAFGCAVFLVGVCIGWYGRGGPFAGLLGVMVGSVFAFGIAAAFSLGVKTEERNDDD